MCNQKNNENLRLMRLDTNPFLVHLTLFTVAFIWAANYTIAKQVMPDFIMPYGFVFMRVVFAMCCFIVIHARFIREKIEIKDFGRLLLCSFFGVVINTLMFFKGLSLTAPINASLIMTFTPVIVLLVSVISLKEQLSIKKTLGVTIAGFAVFKLVTQPSDGIHFSFDLGSCLLLINAVSYALFLITLKPLTQQYHPLTVTKWTFIFGVIMTAPFGVGELIPVKWSMIPPSVWAAVLFVLICATVMTYMLTMIAIKFANPSVVGVYSYVQPVLATIIAVAAGADIITPQKVIFGLLIFMGVYMVSYNQMQQGQDVSKVSDRVS